MGVAWEEEYEEEQLGIRVLYLLHHRLSKLNRRFGDDVAKFANFGLSRAGR